MSRFYGSVDGSAKNQATRRGHKYIEGHVRGWNVGVRVVGKVDVEDKDVFWVYVTGGSSDSSGDTLIATVRAGPDGPVVECP